MISFRSISFLFLLVGLGIYSYWFNQQNHEWIVPHVNDRTPAAVKDTEEFQKLIETPMRVFKREAAAKSIRIGKNKHFTYFAMGQFAVESEKGKNLICLEYPYVRLKFLAEGLSVGDQKPVAWVSAPCLIDKLHNESLSYIPLPFTNLDRYPAEDQEQVYKPNGLKVDLKFEGIVGDWPSMWQLQQIEFLSDTENPHAKTVLIDQQEILKEIGRPILISHE